MDGVALYVDGLDGADELTATATYAELRVGVRYGESSLKRYHVDGLYGAVLGAGSAAGSVYVHHADILVEYHASGLCAVLLLNRKGLDGSGGADLAAEVAVIVAVTLVKFHDGLHDAAQSVFHTGGFKHVAGAFAYAQMA